MIDPARLSAFIASRICHDLVSPVSGVTSALEMLDEPGDSEMDQQFEDGPEPVKICIRNGQIVEFRKELDPELDYDSIGESVGFFKFGADGATRLAEIVAEYDDFNQGDKPHEEALRDLALEYSMPMGVEDITGMTWIEIDFPEDIKRAIEEILPAIGKQT